MGASEDKSVQARWVENGIINYKTAIEPDLLGIKKTRSTQPRSEDHGELVVASIGEERFPLHNNLLAEIKKHAQDEFDPKLIQHIFNSEKVVFISTVDGHFFALDVKKQKVGLPHLQFSHTFKGAGTRILSAAATKLGAVIETDDRVWHFADGERTPVLQLPALSVRTFPLSKNFHNLISITTEQGIFLVGVFDETLRVASM